MTCVELLRQEFRGRRIRIEEDGGMAFEGKIVGTEEIGNFFGVHINFKASVQEQTPRSSRLYGIVAIGLLFVDKSTELNKNADGTITFALQGVGTLTILPSEAGAASRLQSGQQTLFQPEEHKLVQTKLRM
jgi:hypothetical protein